MHEAWGLGFNLFWWHVGNQDLGQESAGGSYTSEEMFAMARVAYCICFCTLSSSSNTETTYGNVSAGCRKNWFVVSSSSSRGPNIPEMLLAFFLKAASQESVPRKIIYLIVIHAKMLGQSYFSSTMQLITAWGCACSFSSSPLFVRD